ncbi:MAG: twin transmembrane helix small protein [Thiobacillus sp.]
MKIIVLLFILLILGSLGSALYYLLKDQGKSDRVVKALTVRIGLSMVLFLSLMAAYYFGWIPETGLR